MNKKWLSIVFSLLLIWAFLSGCAAKQAKWDVKWPFYEVQKNGETVMYLLGTVHFGKKEMYPFPEKIVNRLKDADYLVLEANTDELNQYQVQNIAILEDGPIKHLLTNDALAYLEERAVEYELDFNELLAFKPWFIANLFSNRIAVLSGFEQKFGAESQLEKLAEKYKKEYKYLETGEYSFSMIEKAMPNDQAEKIIMEILPLEEGKENIKRAMDSFLQGRAEDELAEDTLEYKYILKERNEHWMTSIDKYLASDKLHFVAVGAGHFDGSASLLKLIEANGYDVKLVQ